MNVNIELEIYHNTPEMIEKRDMGLPYSLKDAELRTINFFIIDNISPLFENGREYCSISSNGDEFLSPILYKDMQIILHDLCQIPFKTIKYENKS